MLDITVIILTKNEEKNIKDAILSAWKIAKRIIVVDSGSTDDTVEIARQSKAEVLYHPWETHARQFNWALENCNITTEWVYRLDADERITDKLAEEIGKLDPRENNAYELRWQMFFMGKRLKHGGTHSTYVTRLFRFGKARVEDIAMDERFIVEGKIGRLQNDFVHYDYKDIDRWINKHLMYANLELKAYMFSSHDVLTFQHKKRSIYYRLPLFIRAKLYYWYRYYVQCGFLDRREGWLFCYLQAYWYRLIIDAKILEKENVGSDGKKENK